jgi:acyl dehydratase
MTWDEIVVPAELPEVVDEISYQRVVMNSATTWDYVPWHYDPVYATTHGYPTIFVNTMHVAGFVDCIATGWAGPRSRVTRRKVTLAGSIYAGDSMVGRGRVVGKRCEGTRYLVDLEIAVCNQRGELCCPAEVTVEMS